MTVLDSPDDQPLDRHRRLHRQGLLTTALIFVTLALLALLSQRYYYRLDLTATARNTLSPTSTELLRRIDGLVEITAYTRPDPIVRRAVKELAQRYQAIKPDLHLRFVDPDRAPAETRRLGIKADGELAVHLGGRVEVVRRLGEQGLTAALQKLALRAERWVTYVVGHGERDLLGAANHDLGHFGDLLRSRGFSVRPLNLAEAGTVPNNAAVLVISSPRTDYLPSEHEAVDEYVGRGGNLLWLDDPDPEATGRDRLSHLRSRLGLEYQPGIVVDPTSSQPEVVIVSNAGPHRLFQDFSLNTLFPLASMARWSDHPEWRATEILLTADKAWLESNPVSGEVRFDSDTDKAGPLPLGVILEKGSEEAQASDGTQAGERGPGQRVVFIGDGDFLSNSYYANGGNLQLGLALINWLSNEDALVNIPIATAPDLRFEPSFAGLMLINLGPPLALPLAALLIGFSIWRRRKRR